MNKNPTFASSDSPEFENQTDFHFVFDVNEGDDVTLNCEAEGAPPPDFHWTVDGVNIPITSSNFNITQVNTSATYSCTATNYLGNITKQFYVNVIKPTKTVTPAATIITPPASAPRGIHPLHQSRHGTYISNIYCAPKGSSDWISLLLNDRLPRDTDTCWTRGEIWRSGFSELQHTNARCWGNGLGEYSWRHTVWKHYCSHLDAWQTGRLDHKTWMLRYSNRWPVCYGTKYHSL